MIDLNPVRVHEQDGRRPCLVVSDDLYNAGPAEKHIVVPITSKDKGIPYHVRISPPKGGLKMHSYLMCDDIRCVSRERFLARSGVVSSQVIGMVGSCLQILLGT